MDFIAAVLVAHLFGDYVFQNQWMADHKVKRLWPAIVHGFFYTLPFLFITLNPWSLLIIFGTHVVIDRYRLAKYVVWFKNQLAPKSSRFTWSPPKSSEPLLVHNPSKNVSTGPSESPDTNTTGTDDVVVTKKRVLDIHPAVINDKSTGFPLSVPDWMRVWLMIIVDNSLHIAINILAIWLFL